MREDPAHDDGVCEQRDQAAWAAAMRTRQHVESEDAAQELGPGQAELERFLNLRFYKREHLEELISHAASRLLTRTRGGQPLSRPSKRKGIS